MYHYQFEIFQLRAPGLWRELCNWMRGSMQHNGGYSDRFELSTGCSFYDSYDITHLNFGSIFCHEYSFCFLTKRWWANWNQPYWLSLEMIGVLEHSHGALDHCTCTDELSCLTIWSLKSRKRWKLVNLVQKLLFTEIWCQKYQFTYLFLWWHRSHHNIFVRIQFLYGD